MALTHGFVVVLAFHGLPCVGADARSAVPAKPNVILVMTDDQGYGDLSYHGNPVLKTPHLDKLAEESVRFTDFHVAPMCTPTRGQLLTGMDAMRNGATVVCRGRSMIRRDIPIMPQYFSQAGYTTGIFGKWHLGDSYPHRPRDRGFDEVLSFHAWGLTSLADRWKNGYFNPWLLRNGEEKQYEGYCTDIFFDEAMDWIKRQKASDQPFFCYLPTNTPHVPNIAPEEYRKPYCGEHEGIRIPDAFYGMIANIDANIGKLETFLIEEGLRDNTITIFLSDNGTQSRAAAAIFNAGMRDIKGSVMEGGHRVPLFIRWPGGDLQHGREIGELTTVQDLLPTLIDLCGLRKPDAELDGSSLAGLLRGTQRKLTDRMVVVQSSPPSEEPSGEKWRHAVVLWDKWRLIQPDTLFNIADDPHQDRNVAEEHPLVAERMRAHYDAWHAEVTPLFDGRCWITIGSGQANPTFLYANDWIGGYCDNRYGLFHANTTGYWNVIVDRAGEYVFELRRWPEESNKSLTEAFAGPDRKDPSARPIARARLIVGDFDQTIDTKPGDTVARFTVNLKAGKTRLAGQFHDKQGKVLCGAIYVMVKRI